MPVDIEISAEAESMIFGYLDWMEARNTQGSGQRFFEQLSKKLLLLSKSFPYYEPCSNEILKSRNLYCTKFRQWILAFEVIQDKIIVRLFIHKSYLPKQDDANQ